MMWPFKKKIEPEPKLTMGTFKIRDCTATLWYKSPENEAPTTIGLHYEGFVTVTRRCLYGGLSGADMLDNDVHKIGCGMHTRIGSVSIPADRFLAITDIQIVERTVQCEIVDDPDLWPEEVLHPCNT